MRRSFLLLSLFAPSLAAQTPSVPVLDLERTERQWPTTMAGVDTDVAVGAFVAEHPGVGVVVVRDGQLFHSFEPLHMEHFEATGFSNVGAICTVPSVDAGPDLIAAVTPSGLRVLRHSAAGFVDAVVGQGAIAAWAGARDLEVGSFAVPGLPSRYLLGHAPGWVRVALVDDAGVVQTPLFLPTPSGTTVLDAGLVDWVPGDLPEIAVLLSSGTLVMNAAGAPLYWRPQSATGGALAILRHALVPTFTQIRNTGSSWRVETFATDAGGDHCYDGGDLAVAQAVVGLTEFDVNGDDYPDLVVSTGESLRRILVGTATGASAVSAARVDFTDVDPADLPASPAANQVQVAVGDLDRDGLDDLVICQRPTDRLVLIRRVQTQVQLLLDEGGDPGTPKESVSFVASLGFTGGIPSLPEIPAAHGIFGVRLQLPVDLADDVSLDAIVYRVEAEGPAPVAYDPAWLGAIEHYRYPLAAVDSGKLFDLLIPIANAELPVTTGAEIARFVFEFSVVTNNGAVPLKGSSPLFVECAYAPSSPRWADFVATLNPDWALIWWFALLYWDSDIWAGGDTPASGGDAADGNIDSRYVGGLIPLEEQRSDGPPSLPPEKQGTGVAH